MVYLSSPMQIGRKLGSEIQRAGIPGTAYYDGGLLEIVPSSTYQGCVQPWTNGSNKFAGVVLGGTIPALDTMNPGGITTGSNAPPAPRGIKVGRGGQLYRFPYSSAAITNIGAAVYATDDHTITLSAQTTQIGVVADWESGFLWVDFRDYVA